MPNATVRARSTETGAARTTSTNDLGRFEIPGLAPGEYGIEVQAIGFAIAKHTSRLEVGAEHAAGSRLDHRHGADNG